MLKNAMTPAFVIAGMMIVGCQAGETEVPAAPRDLSADAMSVLDEAFVSGRLGTMPAGAVVTEMRTVSPGALEYIESVKNDRKAILAFGQPAFDPEEAGLRIIEQQEKVALSEGLSLSISLHKRDFLLGEPVIVEAILENTSDSVKRLPTRLDPQFQFNTFIVTDPSGRVKGFSPIARACTRGNLLDEDLLPGETVTRYAPIFFHKDGWMFPDVGEYRIQALYRGLTEDAERLDSNVITLTVNPGTEADQRAAELMMGNEQGLFVMWGEGDHLEDGIAALERLVAEYPQSTLATWARYALGSNASVEFLDGRYNEHRAPNPDAALRYLLPIVEDLMSDRGPGLPQDIVDGAFLKAATAFESKGELEQAGRIRDALIEVQTRI